jgi:glycosyltransferase involved in cell wall biosynthesis
MKQELSLHNQLTNELEDFTRNQNKKFPSNELLKIDLHCHDFNSDVPDEILGRILGVPETWLKSKKLIKTLKKNGCNAFTVTNHNNARSCHELIAKKYDVLVGAEFSVMVPDYKIGIHVLTYGFSKNDEKALNKLRYNVYEFLQYTHKRNIPTIWAHPLYHYSVDKQIPFDFFSKMALIFERFEVLNGQRDTWQNMLVKNWIETITPEVINNDAKRFDIDLSLYTNRPYQKSMSGGSDDHMGIYAGQTGTYLHVPNLEERLKTNTTSELALEAIIDHRIVPFGGHQNFEKLTVAFLDYVFQVAMNMKKPDLLRMLLHKGTIQDKIIAIIVSNLFNELKHHKTTMLFIKLFHKSFIGKKPKQIYNLMVKKAYKPIFYEALNIAEAHNSEPEEMVKKIYMSINSISDRLNGVLFKRLQKKNDAFQENASFNELDINSLLEQINISPNIRDYVKSKSKDNKLQVKKVTDFLDGLSFPFLSTLLILAANYLSSKVLYNNRRNLNEFSDKLGKLKHPKRMLWLTDTFDDKNGVSSVLQKMHAEIKNLDLPIDILVCSNTVKPDDHLIVIKPEAELTLPFYKNQTFRIPNVNKIHALFLKNEYDRLICSTEGIMGLISVMLKSAYSVPSYFYIHTDWIMFARKTMNWDTHDIDKVRRALREFYGNFDKLFVLNNDHKIWLSSHKMDFKKKNICLTGHWVDKRFKPVMTNKKEFFNLDADNKVLLYTGRLSKEKGVMDVVVVYEEVKKIIKSVKLVIAGVGPAEEELREKLPDAIFLGWVESKSLPSIYSSADLLLFPSQFDTFGLVILEALSCGLPVIAYNSKGPKDIIINEYCGYIVSDIETMSKKSIEYLQQDKNQELMKNNAIKRACDFSKNDIMDNFIKDVNLV